MKPVSEIFSKTLKQHKTVLANMFQTEDIDLIIPVKKTGEELALAYAECKCQKCKCTDNLQFHHIITKFYKTIMGFWKYESQRNYWANILILCNHCHKSMDYHNVSTENGGTISQKYIDKVKRKYGIS